MNKKEHWDDIYSRKKFTEVTWFQPEPKMSLKLIRDLQLNEEARILDVGAGSSPLVDYLLEDGYHSIYLLDLSKNAFAQSQERLGVRSKSVTWLDGDICNFKFNQKFDIWHDRAVFHFLTQPDDQDKYLKNLNDSLNVGAFFIISTFAEDGPLKCSGLDIVRYGKDKLVDKVGSNFALLDFQKEAHISPGGMEQKFNYWVFKKVKKNKISVNMSGE